MNKILQFNQKNSETVKDETIRGFILEVTALQADGVTPCVIANLNLIALDVVLRRHGRPEVYLMRSYLDDVLTAFFAQSPKYDMQKTLFEDKYKFFIDFGGILQLRKGDELEIRVDARNTAFTSLSTANSHIALETVPAYGAPTMLPVLKYHPIGNGETEIDEALGDGVIKVVVATDYTATYSASVKAKMTDLTIEGHGFRKDVTNNVIEAENRDLLALNPDTPVRQIVAFMSGNPLNGAKIKSKLDQAADADAKVLVVHAMSV